MLYKLYKRAGWADAFGWDIIKDYGKNLGVSEGWFLVYFDPLL